MAERAKANRKSKGRSAKREAKPDGAPGPGHNSAALDEAYRRWLPAIKAAKAQYERAAEQARQKKASLAKVYQSADQDGCHRKGIADALAMMREDPIEVAQRAEAIGRVLQIEESILFTQYDLFRDIKVPAPITNPFLLGQQAGREAAPRDPPYKPGSSEFEAWLEGWDAGQNDNMESLRERSAAPLN